MNVFDLFSGIGGLSYGFYNNPFYTFVGANEIDEDTAKGYSLNHPDTKMFNCDIKELTEEQLKELGKIDIIIGGPPCQSYSLAGRRQMDGKAFLFLEYKRVLNIIKPKFFIFENVPGLLSMQKGTLFPQIQKEFKDLGYTLKYKVLDAADYGVPQHRKRVILVGQLGDENIFQFPEPTHNESNWVTFRDAVKDLPYIENGEQSNEYVDVPLDNDFLKFVRKGSGTELTEHIAPKHSPEIVKMLSYVKEGGTKFEIPEEIRPGGFKTNYSRMWWDTPSATIITRYSSPSMGRYTHPEIDRGLSTREGARLQSFPDNYILYGNKMKKERQIGNAVPPILSIVLANKLQQCVEMS